VGGQDMVGSPKLDRIDINILACLQQNSRISNVDLAEAVGLSPSPCLVRVKRLEKAGYITSFNARLNLAKLASHIIVFTEVTLSDHRREDFIKFEAEIRKYDALQECHLVSGGYDYLLKFVTRSVSSYQEMMESILERNIGVEKYFSYIVIKTIVQHDSVPLKSLLSEG
jgi:DNA-binding Lrp family transcriptional regulator